MYKLIQLHNYYTQLKKQYLQHNTIINRIQSKENISATVNKISNHAKTTLSIQGWWYRCIKYQVFLEVFTSASTDTWKQCSMSIHNQGCLEGGGGGSWGILPWAPFCLWAPKRLIYSNRTVKYSIKAVTTYILPWAPQALWAALFIIKRLSS